MPLRKILILMLLLLLAACGRKGPPRPLLLKLPASVQNLDIQQKGQRFLVSWGLPEVNQDGSPLTDLQGFQVFKMKYDPQRDCPECRDTSVLYATIDLDYLRDVHREGNRLNLWDGGLDPGSGYQYRVVPVNRKVQSGQPATTRRPFFLPPPPPHDLTASGHDRLVRLRWQAPLRVGFGSEMRGFNVYRRRDGGIFSLQPVNSAPLQDPEFEDFGLENGATYNYGVRTLVAIDGWQVESALSPSAVAVPQVGH